MNKKKYIHVKNRLHSIFEENRSTQALLGIKELGNLVNKQSKGSMSIKHAIANKAKNNNINHFTSLHTKEVQYSNFLSLDGGNIVEKNEDNQMA